MAQQSKKNKGSGKAAAGSSSGGGGTYNSNGGVSTAASTPSHAAQHASRNPEKQQQTGARGHAPSPPSSYKTRGASQTETGGTGGRNGFHPTAASPPKGAEGNPQAGPRGGHGGATAGPEERKRKFQKDRAKQGGHVGKKGGETQMQSFAAYIKRLFSYDFRGSFRNRLLGWAVNLAVAAAVIGIFALKAAEEFYSEDVYEVGQREAHLAALQLDASATEMDIRKAYRTLSISLHPDRNPGCKSCPARFAEVAAAYEALMKSFRKQKEGQGGGSSEEAAAATGRGGKGGRSPQDGEGEHEGKSQAGDIVDLTYLPANQPFYPATDNQVWTLLLRSGKDDATKNLYEMWAETALALGKYVKYGLIDVPKNKAILKRLPVKVKFFPAIIVMSPGMPPELYPIMAHPSVEGIRSFISRSFPNHVTLISSASDLRSYLRSSAPSFFQTPVGWLAQPYKVVVVPAADSPASPPVALKSSAMKYRHLFLFAYVQNAKSLLLEGPEAEREEIVSLLKQPFAADAAACSERRRKRQSAGGGGGAKAAAAAAKQQQQEQEDDRCFAAGLPDSEDDSLQFTEPDLKNYLTVLLYSDEGPGMRTRAVERIHIPTLMSRRESQRLAFSKLPRVLTSYIQPRIHPYLYQQNAPLLCRGTPHDRMYTLVLVEPPHVDAAAAAANAGDVSQQQQQQKPASKGATAPAAAASQEEEELSLAEVATLVEASRRKYLEKRRSASGASARDGEREGPDDDDDRETEDYAAEGADDDEGRIHDISFRLQVARLSFDSPGELPGLAGLPRTSPFFDFWKEQLHASRMFVLHLDSSRFAVVPGTAAAPAAKQKEETAQDRQRRQAATKALLSELYQTLEKHVQQHRFGSDGDDEEEDEEGSASPSSTSSSGGSSSDSSISKNRLVWKPLPAACDWTHFIKNCLPTAAAPWWWELLTGYVGISFTQVGVLAAIGATIYFFGSNLSSEALVGVVLGGSLLIGGFEPARIIFSKLWAILRAAA